jgi:3-dehydroquinate synthase
VEQAIRVKAAFVENDPRDRLARHALNLGHTFAHAIEAATDYEVLHGEAVAIGLVAAARLGEELGFTPHETAERLRRLLLALALPVDPPPGLDPGRVLEAMDADKKRRDGRTALVVPVPGGAELLEGVEPELALRALFDRTPQGVPT